MDLSSGGELTIDTVGDKDIKIGGQASAKTITIGNDLTTKFNVDSEKTVESNSFSFQICSILTFVNWMNSSS